MPPASLPQRLIRPPTKKSRTPLLSHHGELARHPLTTYETIVDRIGNVRTATGLRVRAELDAGEYPTGVTVTKEQMDALALVRDAFHGEWNYKLLPRPS